MIKALGHSYIFTSTHNDEEGDAWFLFLMTLSLTAVFVIQVGGAHKSQVSNAISRVTKNNKVKDGGKAGPSLRPK